MAERVRVREREPGANEGLGYWACMEQTKEFLDRGRTGNVVIRTVDREWQQGPMGFTFWYLIPDLHEDTALGHWWVFANDVRIHTGAHKHQGGLIIYILEGAGYTIVEGERHEWEAGDLLLLPLRQGGVEHQHFNNEAGARCKFVAFIYIPWWQALASTQELTQDHPDWKLSGKPSMVGKATR